MVSSRHLLFGAGFIVLGQLMFASMGVGVRITAQEIPNEVIIYFALIGTSVSCVPLIWAWQIPLTHGWFCLFAIAVFATLGQLCLTKGLSLAPAGRMGAFGFFSVIFGAAYGWILWDEMLLWSTVAGSMLIVAAGIFASRQPSKVEDALNLAEAPAAASSRLHDADLAQRHGAKNKRQTVKYR